MPEGPELHLASRFVNRSCKGRIFSGKVEKSEVHKSCEVPFTSQAFTIFAESRGKQMRLCLCDVSNEEKKKLIKNGPMKDKIQRILFQFGMSGKFEFTSLANIHKHAHLKFYTNDKPPMVLSYVDVRRFGRWEVTDDWSKDRGPDPMFEYKDFRSNIINNLKMVAFERPICEVMLNQKYFNGVGNYLRAEILYRLSIPPFEQARKVLEGLPEAPPDIKPKVKGQKLNGKSQNADLLHLCHVVPLEVVNLGGGGYDPEGNKTDYTTFNTWLQCYYQDGMENMVDHNSRTIWFYGTPGPMVPKENKSRSKARKGKDKKSSNEDEDETVSPPKKKKAEEVKKTPKKTTAKKKSVGTRSRKREPASRARSTKVNTPKSVRTKVKSVPNGQKIAKGSADKKAESVPTRKSRRLANLSS